MREAVSLLTLTVELHADAGAGLHAGKTADDMVAVLQASQVHPTALMLSLVNVASLLVSELAGARQVTSREVMQQVATMLQPLMNRDA